MTINILIVEDELIIARNLSRKLKKLNYNVLGVVSSGKAALDAVAKQKPDLILMDIVIKGDMDGIETAAEIYKKYQIPVVYLTAYADQETLKRAKETVPLGYILKPYKEQEVQATIEIALQKHQSDLNERAGYRQKLQSIQKQIEQWKERDSVTQLLNGKALQKAFDLVAGKLMRDRISPDSDKETVESLPILCLKLDRFNTITNHLDLHQSEQLAITLAQRLKDTLEPTDILARTSNDEFVIIPAPIQYRGQAGVVAQSLLDAIAQPLVIEDQEIFVTGSIGASLYPRYNETLSVLLQQARTVVKRLQKNGGNDQDFYNQVIDHKPEANPLNLEVELRYALQRNQFSLAYQPKVHLRTGKIVGTEALIRWTHPQQGKISPAQFIPLAEELGLISEIGLWVFRTACEQFQQWQNQGLPPVNIAINLSGQQLKQPNLHHQLTQIVREYKVSPQFLELELTESVLIEDIDLANRRFSTLKALGFKIAIDDFGTGYSSLSHLAELSFDILKLDCAFVKDIHLKPKNAAIASAIVAMAKDLDLSITAEGVETYNELQFLYNKQCDEMQGYLFSPPVSGEEFAHFLKTGKSLKV